MSGLPPQVRGDVRVGTLDEAGYERWDRFVEQCPEATFFHRAGWKRVVEEAFGHRCHFLYAEANGELQGVLPLGHVRSRLFGNALISAPFGVVGGVAAVTDKARVALEAEALRLTEELDVDYLEMRYRQPHRRDWPVQKDLYVNFRKAIDPDPEQNLKAIPRKQRAMVRKGIKAGLQGELDDSLDRFYPVYAESVRNLGTPVYSLRFFELLREVFGDDCEVLTVTHRGEPAAAVLSFYFRDEVLPYYGGGTAASRDLKANDFMYWDLMRRAAESGVRVFDYGRSKVGTGSYRFKKHWGFEPAALHYEFYLHRAREIPSINPLNPKYRLFIESWKRLPLWLSTRIGPLIVRNLG